MRGQPHLKPRVVSGVEARQGDHVLPHVAQLLPGVPQLVPAHVQVLQVPAALKLNQLSQLIGKFRLNPGLG